MRWTIRRFDPNEFDPEETIAAGTLVLTDGAHTARVTSDDKLVLRTGSRAEVRARLDEILNRAGWGRTNVERPSEQDEDELRQVIEGPPFLRVSGVVGAPNATPTKLTG